MNQNLDRIRTVVLMGAESTGKSTLAKILSEHYQTTWAGEYLRQFVDEKGALPEQSDVDAIAKGHVELVSGLRSQARNVLFVDTDLFTTCVYQRIYFGECPTWIEELALIHKSGLYLFMEPDIPWVPDPGQRASPDERMRSHYLLSKEAKTHSLNTVLIQGSFDHRRETAIRTVDRYLSS